MYIRNYHADIRSYFMDIAARILRAGTGAEIYLSHLISFLYFSAMASTLQQYVKRHATLVQEKVVNHFRG